MAVLMKGMVGDGVGDDTLKMGLIGILDHCPGSFCVLGTWPVDARSVFACTTHQNKSDPHALLRDIKGQRSAGLHVQLTVIYDCIGAPRLHSRHALRLSIVSCVALRHDGLHGSLRQPDGGAFWCWILSLLASLSIAFTARLALELARFRPSVLPSDARSASATMANQNKERRWASGAFVTLLRSFRFSVRTSHTARRETLGMGGPRQ